MTRSRAWWVSYGLLALMCLGLMTYLRPGNKLLTDSDTTMILTEINRRHDPWRWFHHDWPLDNHFYRPIPADLFELDNRLHPHDDYKWGITGDLLCVFTTLGFFWLLRELTDSPALSTLSTALFFLWQMDSALWLSPICLSIAYVTFAIGLWCQRHRPSSWKTIDRSVTFVIRKRTAPFAAKLSALGAILARSLMRSWKTLAVVLPPALIWFWLGMGEIVGITPLGFRMLAWIPGRTASSMTVFAFISLAAFARYMRLLKRKAPEATAYDTPNTRSSQRPVTKNPSVFWPILAIIGEILSFLCYEQAVMVPAILGLVGLAWWLRGAQGKWWLWGIPFGAVLLAYIKVRHQFIPPGNSWYYNWQKRTFQTSIDALNRYLFFFVPPGKTVEFYVTQTPLMMWVTTAPWTFLLTTVSSMTSMWQMRRRYILAGFGWLGSALAYGPMAFFKDFEHYHYWPMAFRALFDVVMVWIALDLTIIALSPQARQAPARLSPAPGSLLHL